MSSALVFVVVSASC